MNPPLLVAGFAVATVGAAGLRIARPPALAADGGPGERLPTDERHEGAEREMPWLAAVALGVGLVALGWLL